MFLEILSFVGLHGVTLIGFYFNILGFLFPVLFLKLSLYMFFNYLYLSWTSFILRHTLFWVDLIHFPCVNYHLPINDDTQIEPLSPDHFIQL